MWVRMRLTLHSLKRTQKKRDEGRRTRAGRVSIILRMKSMTSNRCEIGFESAHLGALYELAMREHAADSVVNRAAKTSPLGGNIDKRNWLIVDAHVLIHCLIHA